MGLTENLRKILQIKEEIRRAISEKGVSCTDNTALAQYPDRIRKISTGSGGGIDTSLCFCQMDAVNPDQQAVYCNNDSRGSGAIRYYDGAGVFLLTADVGNNNRLNISAEE